MGKVKKFINSFKDFMKANGEAEESPEIRNDSDDYAVVKSKKFYVVSIIVSLLAAILIWLVAVTNGSGVGEKIFNISPTLKNQGTFASVAEYNGFNIEMESDVMVSFTLEGRKKSIDDVSIDDISVYIDFGQFVTELDKLPNNTEHFFEAEIVIDAPIYFDISDVSKDKVIVKLVPINKISN